jgi:hypothetical protein
LIVTSDCLRALGDLAKRVNFWRSLLPHQPQIVLRLQIHPLLPNRTSGRLNTACQWQEPGVSNLPTERSARNGLHGPCTELGIIGCLGVLNQILRCQHQQIQNP